jgi:hypothetical protein
MVCRRYLVSSLLTDKSTSLMFGTLLCRTGGLDQDETPFCQEMVELGVANHGVPERLHPKSFHANFGHNTNVWATRNKQVNTRRGHPGLQTQAAPCRRHTTQMTPNLNACILARKIPSLHACGQLQPFLSFSARPLPLQTESATGSTAWRCLTSSPSWALNMCLPPPLTVKNM